jgi:hypothetical protein
MEKCVLYFVFVPVGNKQLFDPDLAGNCKEPMISTNESSGSSPTNLPHLSAVATATSAVVLDANVPLKDTAARRYVISLPPLLQGTPVIKLQLSGQN